MRLNNRERELLLPLRYANCYIYMFLNLQVSLSISVFSEVKKKKELKMNSFPLVIRLGLEPRTPTLKVLCSTC
jgi:hypothetical protein